MLHISAKQNRADSAFGIAKISPTKVREVMAHPVQAFLFKCNSRLTFRSYIVGEIDVPMHIYTLEVSKIAKSS